MCRFNIDLTETCENETDLRSGFAFELCLATNGHAWWETGVCPRLGLVFGPLFCTWKFESHLLFMSIGI